MLDEFSKSLNQTLQRHSSRPEDPGLFSRSTTPIVVHQCEQPTLTLTPSRVYAKGTCADTHWIAGLGSYGTVAVFTHLIQVLDPLAV